MSSYIDGYKDLRLELKCERNLYTDFEAISSAYAYARTDKRHVLYFFAKNELATGTIRNLEPEAEVRLEWFNPRTGEIMPAVEATVKVDGSLVLPQRPDVEDWTLTVLI